MVRRILFKPRLKYFILTYVLPAMLQNMSMSSAAYNFRISLAKLYKRIGGFWYQSFESDQKPFLPISERNGMLHVCSGKLVRNSMRHTITFDFWQIAR